MVSAADVFAPLPPPKSALGHYRMLSPTASVRVSPLCLGSMNFGDAWEGFMGECNYETTEGILDFYYNSGGNFIDTANNYQQEESEKWIGEWMKKRGNRDQTLESASNLRSWHKKSRRSSIDCELPVVVIATKYTTPFRVGYGDKEILVNTAGNGAKSLHVSLEASLKKLQTSYIDLLYVHWWDFTCSIPEMMQSLNHLVASGKVIYLGISDTPAYIVSKANEYARQNGLRQFSVYQGKWSAEYRDFEREIIPMCRDEGMGLCPWGALGAGHFKSDEQRKSQEKGRQFGEASEAAIKISKVLEKIAKAKNTQITSIALAYVMQKTSYVFPIVGGRKIDHLKGNIEGLSVELSDSDINEIEGANAFDIGFPMNFLSGAGAVKNPSDLWLMGAAGSQQHFDVQMKPLGPFKK
ncbi:Dothistromin biosynthesis norB [Hyphodiscus hymeniophilus]|uniref:Dothistromin biosynthesis norB n=1 Tax=Hyphodiscus hymeniophilus TaxID=353542 RepID=A0A9P6VQ44_9HELO|nr:Dothistromin biosynthesis norB [Hyphodiscus hymeniophilus]